MHQEDRHVNMINISDCELHTEDGNIFPAHKANLAIKSEYFLSMFCDNEDAKNEILITGIKGEILRNILSYIYTDEIHITEENFGEILLAAHKLQLNDVLRLMKNNIAENLTLKNCIEVFSAANSINQVDISRHCFRFVETQFERIVLSDKSFYRLPLAELKLLLNDKNLRVSDEKTVWSIIVEWVTADLPNRLHCVPGLLLSLATGEVDESLANEIVKNDIVAKNKFWEENSDMKLPQSNFNSLLQAVLLKYPETTLFIHRNPSILHIIIYKSNNFRNRHTPIYVTYDDKLDLWRKIAEINTGDSFLVLNDSIYVFNIQEFRRYSIVEKEWYQCRNFTTERVFYHAVRLGRRIYTLGGESTANDEFEIIFNVDFYDPEVDEWFEAAAMFPVDHFSAVVLNESIYVLGKKPNSNSEIVAQFYNSVEEAWSLFPNPSKFRIHPHLVAYHEKIFCIGGMNERLEFFKYVEVFDPSKNAWHTVEDLPYAYATLQASVINDRLIVRGNPNKSYVICSPDHLYSTVMWEEDAECWKVIDGPSSCSPMYHYLIAIVEDSEMVNVISKENKNPLIVFEKSPFSETPLIFSQHLNI